jgi:O-antigen/teichoic acid export membrane protein
LRLRALIPAGLVDAGCASLATFVVGLYAARELGPATLGAYALFFSAFLLAAVVPTQLYLLPAEVAVLPRDRLDRLVVWRWTLLPGSAISGAAAAIAGVVALGLARTAGGDHHLALALTMIPAAALSSLQDHLRRVLHLAGRSWRAAAVSVCQLAAVSVAVGVLVAVEAPREAIPFGALLAANAASLTVAATLARPSPATARTGRPGFAQLLRSGRWLLVNGAVPAAAAFAVAAIIAGLAGPEELGYAEAARLVAQPLYVLATGLGLVLGPRSMEAGAAADEVHASAIARPFWALLGSIGVAYLLLTAAPWTGNPMRLVVPLAYEMPGLVALTVVGTAAYTLLSPLRSELVGGREERVVAGAEVAGSVGSTLSALSGQLIGAFARPVSLIVQAVLAGWWLLRVRPRLYQAARRR